MGRKAEGPWSPSVLPLRLLAPPRDGLPQGPLPPADMGSWPQRVPHRQEWPGEHAGRWCALRATQSRQSCPVQTPPHQAEVLGALNGLGWSLVVSACGTRMDRLSSLGPEILFVPETLINMHDSATDAHHCVQTPTCHLLSLCCVCADPTCDVQPPGVPTNCLHRLWNDEETQTEGL